MFKLQRLTIVLLSIFLAACSGAEMASSDSETTPTLKADSILALVLQAHGSAAIDSSSFSFVFRGQRYSISHQNGSAVYTVESIEDDGRVFKDVLIGDSLTRTIDGMVFELPADKAKRAASALNSVIYFATLPYKLQDKAVQISYDTAHFVRDGKYLGLEVSFAKEGGGTDHDDEFYYWINAETHQIEYLAYNYKVNNGGVRFRLAYNTRKVGGVLFQDYENYKAPVGTPLKNLLNLYAIDSLERVSFIDTENVKLLTNK